MSNKGRPNVITSEKVVSIDQIVKVYNYYGTARKAAYALGIDPKTVTKYLKLAGIEVGNKGWEFVNTNDLNLGNEGKRTSEFATWLRNHPDTELPRNYKEISKKTGVNYNTVKCYMLRHKNTAKKWIKENLNDGKLIKQKIFLEAKDKEGVVRPWNTSILSNYTVNVDAFTHLIYIKGIISKNDTEYIVNYRPYSKEELSKLMNDEDEE